MQNTRAAWEIWLIVLMLMLLVGALRAVFLVLPQQWRPRGLLEDALRYAPLAALAALVAPQVFASLLSPDVSAGAGADWWDPRLLSALIVVLVVRWRGNVFLGVVAGAFSYLWMLR